MPRYTIVVDRLRDWRWSTAGLDIVTADRYLAVDDASRHNPRVIVLVRAYRYVSAGYYCSLLAEARGQIPMPAVADVLALSRKGLSAFALPELDAILKRTLKRLGDPPSGDFDLTVVFGRSDDPRFKKLAAECFDLFRFPIMKLRVRGGPGGGLWAVRPLGLHQLPADLGDLFLEALRAYTRARKPLSGGRPPARYNLAILHDPSEALPPSDEGALERLQRLAPKRSVEVELITRRDFARVPEFDALFIRTTTAINHYTYHFARKAEQEGLVVIDDSASILRCANKVYLHELLQRHGIPAPRARIINRATFDSDAVEALEGELGYPMVLKIPDGSFSRGIHRAKNRPALLECARSLLARSRLILAQEFVYTPFDWRIGVLANEPLFACQYQMSGRHWQIIHHRSDGKVAEGGTETFAIEDAPRAVVRAALKVTGLIGDGLYGVDLKETNRGVVVIEVNDNPNIDRGVEDRVLGDALYDRLLEEFIRRIDRDRAGSLADSGQARAAAVDHPNTVAGIGDRRR